MCVRACVCVCVCVYARACVRVCVRARAPVYVQPPAHMRPARPLTHTHTHSHTHTPQPPPPPHTARQADDDRRAAGRLAWFNAKRAEFGLEKLRVREPMEVADDGDAEEDEEGGVLDVDDAAVKMEEEEQEVRFVMRTHAVTPTRARTDARTDAQTNPYTHANTRARGHTHTHTHACTHPFTHTGAAN